MPTIPSLVGHVISGYYIEQAIIQGQASTALRARHTASQQAATFTIALLPETLSAEAFATFMTRFTERATQLTVLSHAHLLSVLDYGEYGGYPYLVTANSEGPSLATVLKQQGRYSQEGTLAVMRQCASVLDYAHQHGIVHGNLRPATLLLQRDQHIRLTGLEMAHLLEARGISESIQPYPHLRNLLGTYLSDPAYLAPECVQGRPADARSDLYALGLLFFELLSGTRPFSGNSYLDIALQHVQGPPPSFASRCPELGLPSEFDQLLDHALAYAPERRFVRAADLVSAYEHILEQQREAIERHSTVSFARHTLATEPGLGHAASVQSQDMLMPHQAAFDVRPTAVLSAKPQREQDLALLRQIEEHIWDGYDLPVPRQTEPTLSIPLATLFSSESQRLTLPRRTVLYLCAGIGTLVFGSIGLGAWGMGQLQHHPPSQQPQQPVTQPQQNKQRPAQPASPAQPLQPAQPINDVQQNQTPGQATLALPVGGLIIGGSAALRGATASSNSALARWSARKLATRREQTPRKHAWISRAKRGKKHDSTPGD